MKKQNKLWHGYEFKHLNLFWKDNSLRAPNNNKEQETTWNSETKLNAAVGEDRWNIRGPHRITKGCISDWCQTDAACSITVKPLSDVHFFPLIWWQLNMLAGTSTLVLFHKKLSCRKRWSVAVTLANR